MTDPVPYVLLCLIVGILAWRIGRLEVKIETLNTLGTLGETPEQTKAEKP